MKFISKSSNLLIVLRPGLQAQPLTGSPAKPTISVRFKDGMAEVESQELIDMMLAHPGFNGDFISADSVQNADPYSSLRRPSEPAHVLTDMRYGTPVSRKIVGGGSFLSTLSPEMQKAVQETAMSMAKEMLPGMIKTTLEGLVGAHEASKAAQPTEPLTGLTKAGKPKKRPGRKPKSKTAEKVPVSVEENSSSVQ
jgi:hypothetical protein